MLTCALLLLAAAAADPPAATLASLEGALERLADPAQVQRFRVTTTASYADTDGDDAHTDVVVNQISFDSAGEQTNTKLSHVHDGEPVTEPDPEEQDGEEKQVGFSLALPAGEDLPRYVYGPTTQQGTAAVARYQPAPGEPSADDLATGQVAWDPSTGRPLWITFEPVDKPFMVKSLDNRLIIGETAGRLHTARIISAGIGGPPLMRKKFELDMSFHDIVWR